MYPSPMCIDSLYVNPTPPNPPKTTTTTTTKKQQTNQQTTTTNKQTNNKQKRLFKPTLGSTCPKNRSDHLSAKGHGVYNVDRGVAHVDELERHNL